MMSKRLGEQYSEQAVSTRFKIHEKYGNLILDPHCHIVMSCCRRDHCDAHVDMNVTFTPTSVGFSRGTNFGTCITLEAIRPSLPLCSLIRTHFLPRSGFVESTNLPIDYFYASDESPQTTHWPSNVIICGSRELVGIRETTLSLILYNSKREIALLVGTAQFEGLIHMPEAF